MDSGWIKAVLDCVYFDSGMMGGGRYVCDGSGMGVGFVEEPAINSGELRSHCCEEGDVDDETEFVVGEGLRTSTLEDFHSDEFAGRIALGSIKCEATCEYN